MCQFENHSRVERSLHHEQVIYYLGSKYKFVNLVNILDSSNEKVPYPPAYAEIYPVVPPADMGGPNIGGWQSPPSVQVVAPEQPPVYVTQHPGMQNNVAQSKLFNLNSLVLVTNVIMQNQSRVGLYPVKLQPCPHCQIEGNTFIKQEATIRTHLLALILCLTW